MKKNILILGAASEIANFFINKYVDKFNFVGVDFCESKLQNRFVYYWIESACNPCFLYNLYECLSNNKMLPDIILHFSVLDIKEEKSINDIRIEHLSGQLNTAILPYILCKQIFTNTPNLIISTDATRLAGVWSYKLAKSLQNIVATPEELLYLGSVQNTKTYNKFTEYADEIISLDKACELIFNKI